MTSVLIACIVLECGGRLAPDGAGLQILDFWCLGTLPDLFRTITLVIRERRVDGNSGTAAIAVSFRLVQFTRFVDRKHMYVECLEKYLN